MGDKNLYHLVASFFVFLLAFVQPCYAMFPSDSAIVDTTLEDSLYTHEVSSSNVATSVDLNINITEPILSPQTVLTPFPIVISANNASFSGRVYLSSALGPVKPTYVDLTNGKWTGDITLFEIGKSNHLILRWDNEGKSGVSTSISNIFDTLDLPNIYQDGKNDIYQNANLVVKITDSNGIPINGAEATLFSDDIKKCKEIVIAPFAREISDKGKYNFNNVYPGVYYLEIHNPNYQDTVKKVKLAAKRTVNVNVTLHDTCNTKGNVPVLLVPGIMGSYSKEKAYVVWPYPRLPPDSPEWDSDTLELLDPFGYVGWNTLTKELQKHGYIKGCTVFNVPYDWSLSIPDIRDKYLIPWIKQAKKISGSNKVDIVAHSMGGLVTRSYIQSDLYKNDVRKFAMVGTPNKGGASVYYIWESGDPIAADNASGETGVFSPTAYFYSNTLYQFYYDRYWDHICKFDSVRRYKPLHCNKKEIYNTVHNKAMSSGQLMPIYDHALLSNDDISKKIPIEKEENTFLKALNNLPCFNSNGCVDIYGKKYSFKAPQDVFTRDTSGVQTKLFMGHDELTTSSIKVKPQLLGYKGKIDKDGIPKDPVNEKIGDGTVPIESGDFNDFFPKGKTLELIKKQAKHSHLISVFSHELTEFIIGTKASIPTLTQKNQPKTLAISINGRVHLHAVSITDSRGNPIKTEDILKEEHHIDLSGLLLENPPSGEYTITLVSPHNENYEIAILYYDNDTDRLFSQRYLGFFDNSSKTVSFKINNQISDKPINFDEVRIFATPTDLKINNVNNKTILTWEDKIGDINSDIDHYEIYMKKNNEPYLYLLGQIKEKSYQLDYDLQNAVTNTYAVRTVLKDGSSTFLSQPTFFDVE